MEQRTYQNLTIDIELLKVESCVIKNMDLEHYYKLKTSLRDYGQLRNILTDDAYNVVEGRKIAGVMRELGYKTIEIKIVPNDYIIPRLNLDSEYSTFDFVKVSMQLSKTFDLERKDWLKDVLPFKNVDIDDYIEGVQFSFDKFNTHKNQAQGTLFAAEAPPEPVKPQIKPFVAPTLFEQVEEVIAEEEVPVVVEVIAPPEPEETTGAEIAQVVKEPEPETFADRRAREVREAAERQKQQEDGSAGQDINDNG